MSKYFTSVLKLVENPEGIPGKGEGDDILQVDHDSSKLTLQADQPHPPSTSSRKQATLSFDKILPTNVSSSSLYKQTAKEVVESALLGYHGTVITFSNSASTKAKSSALWSGREGFIQAATRHMFRCLKKSRKSKTKSSASNLVILCSFVMVSEEEVRDLLYDTKQGDVDGVDSHEGTYLPPKLDIVNGRLHGVSQYPLTSSTEVSAIIRSGREMKEKLLKTVYMTASQSYHTIFTLTVEFSQFGSMNAPVSGNMSFVDMAASDFLAKRQSFTRGETVDKSVKSLFAFADVVTSLSRNMAALNTSESAFNLEAESQLLPHVPTTESANLHDNSVLTQLIKESLGGNCKTLLITFVDAYTTASHSPGLTETLKLASRACVIQNTPNKRDLAEKALMSAYLRGLEEVYGKEVREKEEQPMPVLHSPTVPAPGGWEREAAVRSQVSVQSDDMDNVYDEMISATKGEERQKNMELAATALVAAALEDKDEGVDGSGSESEYEEDVSSVTSTGSQNSSGGNARLQNSSGGNARLQNSSGGNARLQSSKSKAKAKEKPKRRESVLLLQDKQQNVTLEVLVAMLQDPDEGVPRPSLEELDNVQIKKGAGAIFSGSAITKWLLTHISGVRSEEDAQMLGQLLLESGLIFHSEGSRVFAGAETLFYHAKHATTNQKSLSHEEIQSLLKTTTPAADQTGSVDPSASNLEVKVAHELAHPKPSRIAEPVYDGDLLGGESAPKSREDAEVRSSEAGSRAAVPVGVAGKEGMVRAGEEGMKVVVEPVPREEWMKTGESDEENEGEGKGEEFEEEYEEEVTTDPNTAPLERIPSLHTLEIQNTVDYPHPLHMAAAIGKSPGVLRELVMMFGVNKLDNSRRTALMFAALGNNKSSTCSTLLRCSAEVDLQDISGLTALHVACYHGNKSAASILLANKASIACRDKLGHTALHWCMVPSDIGCLELLTHHSMHPDLLNHADRSGLTTMHWSIFYDHPQHLSMLLKRCNKAGRIELTKLDSEGRTLAIYAIEKNSPACLKVLLDASPSLLTLPDHQGTLPSHHASTQSSPDTLNTLLNFNPPKKSQTPPLDVNARDQAQWTSLHYAVGYNKLEVVRVLVARGALVDAQDNEGRTPMDYAVQLSEGKDEMLAALRGEPGVVDAGKDDRIQPNTAAIQIEPRRRSKICNLL